MYNTHNNTSTSATYNLHICGNNNDNIVGNGGGYDGGRDTHTHSSISLRRATPSFININTHSSNSIRMNAVLLCGYVSASRVTLMCSKMKRIHFCVTSVVQFFTRLICKRARVCVCVRVFCPPLRNSPFPRFPFTPTKYKWSIVTHSRKQST